MKNFNEVNLKKSIYYYILEIIAFIYLMYSFLKCVLLLFLNSRMIEQYLIYMPTYIYFIKIYKQETVDKW